MLKADLLLSFHLVCEVWEFSDLFVVTAVWISSLHTFISASTGASNYTAYKQTVQPVVIKGLYPQVDPNPVFHVDFPDIVFTSREPTSDSLWISL